MHHFSRAQAVRLKDSCISKTWREIQILWSIRQNNSALLKFSTFTSYHKISKFHFTSVNCDAKILLAMGYGSSARAEIILGIQF